MPGRRHIKILSSPLLSKSSARCVVLRYSHCRNVTKSKLIFKGNSRVVSVLVNDHRAAVDVCDSQERTPLQLAKAGNRTQTAKLLSENNL